MKDGVDARSSPTVNGVDDDVKRGVPDVVLLGAEDTRLDLDWPSDINDGVDARSSPNMNGVDDGVKRDVPNVVVLGTGVVRLDAV